MVKDFETLDRITTVIGYSKQIESFIIKAEECANKGDIESCKYYLSTIKRISQTCADLLGGVL